MNFPLSGNLLKDEIKISKDFLEFCLQNNLKISLKNGEFGADIKINKKLKNAKHLVKQITDLYLSGNLYPPRFFCLFEFKDQRKFQQMIKNFLGSKYVNSRILYKDEIKKRREETSLEKFGVTCNFKLETTQDQIKKTNLERYGVENPMQAKEILEKRDNTNFERYGVKTPLQNREVVDKGKQTILEKYGVDNVAKSKEIQEKIKQTNLERYGVPVAWQKPEIFEESLQKVREVCKDRYGFEFPSQSATVKDKISQSVKLQRMQVDPRYAEFQRLKRQLEENNMDPEFQIEMRKFLKENYAYSSVCAHSIKLGLRQPKVSIPEQLMRDLIKSLGIENVLYNKRFKEMQGLEFDLFLPDFNLAIEVNGVYWHSEQFRGKHYHQRKKLLALSEGFELLMFTDVEILEHFDVCKSLILKSLKKIPEISFKKLKNSTGKFDRSDVERFIKENWFEMNKVENFEVFTKNSEIVLVKTFDTAGNLVQSVESLKFSVDEITENQKHFDLCLSKDFLKSKDLSEPEELIEGYFNGGKLKF